MEFWFLVSHVPPYPGRILRSNFNPKTKNFKIKITRMLDMILMHPGSWDAGLFPRNLLPHLLPHLLLLLHLPSILHLLLHLPAAGW
jgi:hypothetical protein